MKKFAFIGIIIVIIGGGYFLYPYFSIRNFALGVNNKNQQVIKEHVDFSLLRTSIKQQLNTMMLQELKKMQKTNSDNSAALMAFALVSSIVDSSVDLYVSPEGITKLIQNGEINNKSKKEDKSSKGGTKTVTSTNFTKQMIKNMGFTGIREFTIKIQPNIKNKPLTLIFTLQGISWRLTDIKLGLID